MEIELFLNNRKSHKNDDTSNDDTSNDDTYKDDTYKAKQLSTLE